MRAAPAAATHAARPPGRGPAWEARPGRDGRRAGQPGLPREADARPARARLPPGSHARAAQANLGATPLVLTLPIGGEENFLGVVDLVAMKGITWQGEARPTPPPPLLPPNSRPGAALQPAFDPPARAAAR